MADKTQEVGGIHFPFPFPPYPIQKAFMTKLYQVLEAGKIGIFESPTGTVSLRDMGRWLRQLEGSLAGFCSSPRQRFPGLEVGQHSPSVYLSELS